MALTTLAWGTLRWLLQRPIRITWDLLLVVPYAHLPREAQIDWVAQARVRSGGP